ncbi:MAG TPA: LPD7 domain-containing protein, partial [Anaeromyxobacteraceae bacterium]|nr:LPD7 domain-containing protein [Anaeromyxobacteraceae bacterium]
GHVGFVDKGSLIDILKTEAADTLAALQLATQKWERITVLGSDEFKATCVRLAVELPGAARDLADAIAEERQRQKSEFGRASRRRPGAAGPRSRRAGLSDVMRQGALTQTHTATWGVPPSGPPTPRRGPLRRLLFGVAERVHRFALVMSWTPIRTPGRANTRLWSRASSRKG